MGPVEPTVAARTHACLQGTKARVQIEIPFPLPFPVPPSNMRVSTHIAGDISA